MRYGATSLPMLINVSIIFSPLFRGRLVFLAPALVPMLLRPTLEQPMMARIIGAI